MGSVHARLSLVAAALALWPGCARPVRVGLLPERVTIVVEDAESGLVTLLVELRRNARAQLDVRVADGAVAYDGTRLVNLHANGGTWERDGGPTVPRARLDVPHGGRLEALSAEDATFVTPEGARVRCPHAGACAPTDVEAAPPSYDAAGPGAGFHVRLDGGALTVSLPQVPEGTVVWEGVRAVRGVLWVHAGGAGLEPLVNRRFRGHAALVAAPFADRVLVDGDPTEWDASTPLVIDAPWQVHAGADVHHGARDASFSLAAAWAPARVCLAGRVRDDEVQPGDVLELAVGEARTVLPLDPSEGAIGVRSALFGATFEWCADVAVPGAGQELALEASLVDRDGTDAPTRIASAHDGAVAARGRLILSPAAPGAAPRSP